MSEEEKKYMRLRWEKSDDWHKSLEENLKTHLPGLKSLLNEVGGHWDYEDLIYRMYYGSFKVYRIQELTEKMVQALQSLVPPEVKFDSTFQKIVEEGTGHEFDLSHNQEWDKRARPMVEAFFHAKFFLEMAVKYGTEIKGGSQMTPFLPSGFAALLCLYNLR